MHTSRTDHNILSLHLLLPAHPPLHNPTEPKKQYPPSQTFHKISVRFIWKLKHTDIKETFQKDLEVTASAILPQLQVLLDNTTHQTPQDRADAACNLVQTALHDTASSILSSPTHTNKPAGTPTTKTPDTQQHTHSNPTTTAITLRLKIQKLRDTISARNKENSDNLQLQSLKKLRNKKTKELAPDYKRQNSALFHIQAHDIKVTPFNATMNTAWQLLHD